MQSFVYEPPGTRVVFGTGAIDRLRGEVARLGLSRVLVLSTPRQRPLAEAVSSRLGPAAAGICDRAAMHVPVEVAQVARAEAARLGADACIAIGGGSTIGLAKAVALDLGLPIIAVPTTYSGSEMTPIWGLTEAGAKRTGRDRRVLPRMVLYDPALTLALPPHVAAASGMNALAHCVEALYAADGNPVVALMAEEGARALAEGLVRLTEAPDAPEPRGTALYGAWLAGTCLGAVAMGLHHKLCHTLGGRLNLPHAETHAIVLPHAAAYNAPAAPEAMTRIARALGAADAPGALYDLGRRLGLKMALKDLSVARSDLDPIAELATETPYPNPAPPTRPAIRALLDDAWAGRRPDSDRLPVR